MSEDSQPREFTPDWAVAPGVFLRRLMEERKIGPATLALRGGTGLQVVRGVLDGTVRVDTAVAARLAAALGTGAKFWLDAQAAHDAAIARGATDYNDVGEDPECE